MNYCYYNMSNTIELFYNFLKFYVYEVFNLTYFMTFISLKFVGT